MNALLSLSLATPGSQVRARGVTGEGRAARWYARAWAAIWLGGDRDA